MEALCERQKTPCANIKWYNYKTNAEFDSKIVFYTTAPRDWAYHSRVTIGNSRVRGVNFGMNQSFPYSQLKSTSPISFVAISVVVRIIFFLLVKSRHLTRRRKAEPSWNDDNAEISTSDQFSSIPKTHTRKLPSSSVGKRQPQSQIGRHQFCR